jgi:hypothetical protein
MALAMRHAKTHLPPVVLANSGQSIRKRGPFLAIPGILRKRQCSLTDEPISQQRHQRKESQQAWRYSCNGMFGPLPLSFHPEPRAYFLEGDLYLPTPYEPAHDGEKRLG